MVRKQSPNEEIFYIRSREDFDLICSPIRASILESLVAFGPMPAREVAARIERSAALTHHHLGILTRGGLVREVAREKRGKHLERVFAIGTENWKYDFDTDPRAIAEGILRIARTWGRYSERLLTGVFRDQRTFSPRMQRGLSVRAETGRLSEASAEALRGHLLAIRQLFEQDRKRGEGEIYQIFWSCFPLEKAVKQAERVQKNSQKRLKKWNQPTNKRVKLKTGKAR
jgi:DNA-binding transcriptional ArsR family regulator